MPSPIEDWYMQIPAFTRLYFTSIMAVTLALQLDWVKLHQLYYTPSRAFSLGQPHRLLTNFLYLGGFSLDWFLNIYFIVQHCRDLEEGSFINRPADFAMVLTSLCVVLLAIGPYFGAYFLGSMLVSALAYMWSRYYSYLFINMMGLVTIPASYFPWVMLAFGFVLEKSWPTVELAAMAVGHLFWFLDDEWPRRPESGGSRPLAAPRFLCRLLKQDVAGDVEYNEIEIPAVEPEVEPLLAEPLAEAEAEAEVEVEANVDADADADVDPLPPYRENAEQVIDNDDLPLGLLRQRRTAHA
ncbi:hypothetical protein GGI07_003028 [Coemansia sp. Benny D115]|nr:hypothetical protein GGI07_003028 [Coemansia sp. Benny D115]